MKKKICRFVKKIVLLHPNMEITIDNRSGFCFGVTSAIKKAEEELKRGSLYCLGDIVHNGQEVDRLEQLGLRTISYEEFGNLRHARVLLRAHGEPPSTYQTAQANQIDIIDASCPVVLGLQKRIRQTYTAHPDAQIVIFGKIGHAEVIGLQGQTDNRAIVIESGKDLHLIDPQRDIYLFSQTTKSVEEFQQIVETIRQLVAAHPKGGFFAWHDTICRNVANRVNELKAFARANDVVVFVGGKKSSNAKVLYNHCHETNSNTVFVSSPDELQTGDPDSTWNKLLRTFPAQSIKIGICGATSTPLWLMEKCKQHIEQTAYKTYI